MPYNIHRKVSNLEHNPNIALEIYSNRWFRKTYHKYGDRNLLKHQQANSSVVCDRRVHEYTRSQQNKLNIEAIYSERGCVLRVALQMA